MKAVRSVPGCTGKRPYDDGASARRIVKTARKRGVRLHAYACPFCAHWHTTGETGARSRADRSQAMVTLAARRGADRVQTIP